MREQVHAAREADPVVQVAILAAVLEVRSRVDVAHVATATIRVHERLPALLAFGIEDPHLFEVQLVQSPEAQLKRAREIRLLRRRNPEVDTGAAREVLREVLLDGALQE